MAKYILSILLLTSVTFCFGQIDSISAFNPISLKTLLNYEKADSVWKPNDSTIYFKFSPSTDTIYFQSDTIKAIMLVCDTSLNKWIVPTHWGFQKDENSSLNNLGFGAVGYDVLIMEHEDSAYDYSLKWINGYIVNSLSGAYLDKNKKPLNKNIIVWQSKIIDK